jgi:hypothetical protein
MKHLYGCQSCKTFSGHSVGDHIFLYVVDMFHHPLYLNIMDIVHWLSPLYSYKYKIILTLVMITSN